MTSEPTIVVSAAYQEDWDQDITFYVVTPTPDLAVAGLEAANERLSLVGHSGTEFRDEEEMFAAADRHDYTASYRQRCCVQARWCTRLDRHQGVNQRRYVAHHDPDRGRGVGSGRRD